MIGFNQRFVTKLRNFQEEVDRKLLNQSQYLEVKLQTHIYFVSNLTNVTLLNFEERLMKNMQEKLNSSLTIVTEKILSYIDEKFKKYDKRFKRIDRNFKLLNSKLEILSKRIENIEKVINIKGKDLEKIESSDQNKDMINNQVSNLVVQIQNNFQNQNEFQKEKDDIE